MGQGGRSQGSYLANPHSGEMSHFFFSKAVSSVESLFATHPALVDRIYRLEPKWDGSTVTQHQIKTARQKAEENYQQRQAEKELQK